MDSVSGLRLGVRAAEDRHALTGGDPAHLLLEPEAATVKHALAMSTLSKTVLAGTLLVSARPFRVGDRVRMQGGGLAGSIEGVVSSVGLLYTILASGEDPIMVPNSVVMSVAVVPLREPTGVELRARLRPGATPLDVQERLQEALTVPLRGPPRVPGVGHASSAGEPAAARAREAGHDRPPLRAPPAVAVAEADVAAASDLRPRVRDA